MQIHYTEDENLHLIYRIETQEDDIIEDKISFKKDGIFENKRYFENTKR